MLEWSSILKLTVILGQAPSRGHTVHASREVVGGFSEAHGRHLSAELSGSGQLDQEDVVIDGVAVVIRVLDGLGEMDTDTFSIQIFK